MQQRIADLCLARDGLPVRIFWHFCVQPLGVRLCVVMHMSIVYCVDVARRGRYYIGVTMDPFRRFLGRKSHKHHHSWQSMIVLAVSTSSGIRRLERLVLADERCGCAHYRCNNVGRGGEGVRSDGDSTDPYFRYVVYDALSCHRFINPFIHQ